MQIKITALDTLFFRDGKPFSMGEETWASGIFPPPPSVFYGALRTLYFSVFPEKFASIDIDDPTKNLVISQIHFLLGEEKLYPCPGDFVQIKDSDNQHILLNLKKATGTFSSYPLGYLLTADTDLQVKSNIETGLLDSNDFEDDYTVGSSPNSIHLIEKYVHAEPKIGIGRNDISLTSEEGKLYRVEMRRLKNRDGQSLDFLVDFENLDFQGKLPAIGYLKIGGENKVATYEIVKIDPPTYHEFNNNIFKLVLLTPAIFKNGWYPDFLDENFKGNVTGQTVKLIGACIGKAVMIGGFDMKEREPKPMFRAVPAGSVYFFETEGKQLMNLNSKPFKLACVNQLEKEGFGIGCWANVTSQKK